MTMRWGELPRTTRDEVRRLAQKGYPHPDPAIQRAAADWGVRVRRLLVWLFPLMAVAVLPTFLPSSWRYGASGVVDFLLGAWIRGAEILVLVGAIWFTVSVRHSERVERVNTEALLNAVHRPATEPFTAHRRLLVPGYDLGVVTWGVFAATMTLSMLDSVGEMTAEDSPAILRTLTPWAESVVITFGVSLGAIHLATAAMIPRGRGALVALDADGVTIPHLGLAFGWAEVDRVEFGHGMSLAFRLRDADGVLRRAQPKPWRRWQVRHLQGVLSIPAVSMREPISEVVAKARALHSASLAGTAAR
ncbi:hypothetical protein AB0H43_35790 [Hamadaea sp. NPDC050747]|uniref:hypothetical protein n=1 Tax=Hamadaea sp. NPDC050747 TaxID=3155789 RepID=UPI0033E951E1